MLTVRTGLCLPAVFLLLQLSLHSDLGGVHQSTAPDDKYLDCAVPCDQVSREGRVSDCPHQVPHPALVLSHQQDDDWLGGGECPGEQAVSQVQGGEKDLLLLPCSAGSPAASIAEVCQATH